MEKAMKLGNGLMFALAALYDSARTWLNDKSELFTAILNAGEAKEDYEEISRLQVIHVHVGMIAFLLVLGFVGSLENM